MLEILKILEGLVLAGLNGIVVLQTTVELCVQPLKWRACLLCNYAGIMDPI